MYKMAHTEDPFLDLRLTCSSWGQLSVEGTQTDRRGEIHLPEPRLLTGNNPAPLFSTKAKQNKGLQLGSVDLSYLLNPVPYLSAPGVAPTKFFMFI